MDAFSNNELVSVCMITYNHEAFIAQAIESVMLQRCNFNVELVIGEDCSTDNTLSIIKDYCQRYPSRIRLITSSHNVGMQPNFIRTHQACNGEFIAFIEGDDYWIDPDKLQVQVDSLKARPDHVLCFHDAETFHTVDNSAAWKFSERFSHILPPDGAPPQSYTQLDLARWGWFMPTASIILRTSSLPRPLPEWFAKIHSGDFTVQLLSTQHGSALYLPKVMSRYRLHAHSTTATTSNTLYQFNSHIYTGHMFKQHVFKRKNREYADIYLAQQYGYYAAYLGTKGLRKEQFLNLAKSLFFNRQRIPLFFKRRIAKILGRTE
jgi:glycosyltransferase involved in cell wall biosynthesis